MIDIPMLKRVKAARVMASMSQVEAAKALGFSSPTSVSMLESGDRRMDVCMLKRMADVYSVDAVWLFNGSYDTSHSRIDEFIELYESIDLDDIDKVIQLLEIIKKGYGYDNTI